MKSCAQDIKNYLICNPAIFTHAETADIPNATKPLLIAVSSDRGLCGGIHSSISKAVKKELAKDSAAGVAVLGMKAKSQIQKDFRSRIWVSSEQLTKNPPT